MCLYGSHQLHACVGLTSTESLDQSASERERAFTSVHARQYTAGATRMSRLVVYTLPHDIYLRPNRPSAMRPPSSSPVGSRLRAFTVRPAQPATNRLLTWICRGGREVCTPGAGCGVDTDHSTCSAQASAGYQPA